MAGGVFGVREFRVVWAAEVLSIAGDQLARVALAVLVYGRTGSAAWAAGAYALTFLPALLGGVLLARLADSHPRRDVMVAADLLRAVLVAGMAVPGLPLAPLAVLLVLVVLLGSPFTAAQGALLPEMLPGALYERGLAVRQITSQTAQLAGFATGGVLVAALSPTTALLLDAATFAVSAALLRLGLTARPHPNRPHPEPPHPEPPQPEHPQPEHPHPERPHPGSPVTEDAAPSGIRDSTPTPRRVLPATARDPERGQVFRGIARDPARRRVMLLAWLVGFYVVPEALAAPYAAGQGAGPAAVGVLMAADPLGSIAGVWLFVRFVPETTRRRMVGPLAVAAGIPLAACAGSPPIAVAAALFALSGMLSTSYLLQAQADFVRATPAPERGRAIGIASSGLIAGQGLAVLAAGVLADATGVAAAIALAGLAGAALSAPAGLRRNPILVKAR